jgi:NADH:ubiquinone oxidoreductase subunit 6 (subunit J)
MFDLIISFLIGIIDIFLIVAMFNSKEMMHAALFLAIIFFMNAITFLVLNQQLLAVIQLMIMVGGIATYIFVSVAPIKKPSFNGTNMPALALLSILIFIAIAYPLVQKGYISSNTINYSFDVTSMLNYVTFNVSIFYVIVIMLFTSALGAIIIMKMPGLLE